MSYYSMQFEIDWVRDVISGKINFRKCPLCDKDGIEIQAYDDNGNPCASDHPEARHETCESCQGLAFIEIPS